MMIVADILKIDPPTDTFEVLMVSENILVIYDKMMILINTHTDIFTTFTNLITLKVLMILVLLTEIE